MSQNQKTSWVRRIQFSSFFRSSLQRRLIVMIFCMAVFPILISSVIGNFWFQRTLQKSTVREFKLSNELISQRIKSELRFVQETMGFAFRNFEQRSFSGRSQTPSPPQTPDEADGEVIDSAAGGTMLSGLLKVLQTNIDTQQSVTMRQALREMINSPTLFRAIDYVSSQGAHIEGFLIDSKVPYNWTPRQPEHAPDFLQDMGYVEFLAFLDRMRDNFENRIKNSTGRVQPIIGNGIPGTFISDVVPAKDMLGQIIQPITPVIHIWAVNRLIFRTNSDSRRSSRGSNDSPYFMRLEINAQEFFQRLVSQNEEFASSTGDYENAFVGLPGGDYLLHPDQDCILCSHTGHKGMSWKTDFPELLQRLNNADTEVFFDRAHNQVVAAQRVYFDETDESRHWILIRSVPMQNVLSAVTNLRRLTVILVLIMMVIVVPATLWITRGFTRPIRALVAATDKIAEGDLETDIPVRVEDELGQLADSYEKMKARIRNMIQYLKDRQAVAESANRAKSTFLANMSHELRTPLNGILGYAQILRQNPDLTPKQAEGVNVILRSGEHLLSLINDILDLSKVEAGRMELHPTDFSLHDLLDNLSRIIELRARQKKIVYKLIKGEGLPDTVHGDDSRLRQILMNLLSNAVKFTDHGEVLLTAKFHEKKIRFEVIDTGHGIPNEHLESIFSPFQQVGRVDRMTEGTGLGLAISRKLTQMLGGELKVKSEVGKGSRFYFEIDLPKATGLTSNPADSTMHWMGPGIRDAKKVEAAKQAANDPRTIVGYVGPRRKIMIVDDKSENRAILKELLTPLGFVTIEAEDGEEAVRIYQKELPDLILMDLRMPRCDGYEATRRIRALDASTEPENPYHPVIITISASAFASNRQDSLNAGATDFIPKPVRRSLLLETIHEHLHIDWEYENSPATDRALAADSNRSDAEISSIQGRVCVQCVQYVDDLIDLARRGNLKGLETKLTEMVESKPQMQFIDSTIRPMVRGFKMKEINHYLQHSREELVQRLNT